MNDVIKFCEGIKYIDKYYQVWTAKLLNENKCVWKEDSGYGAWDKGRGLKFLKITN